MSLPTESDISVFINEYLQALSEIVEKCKSKILETNIKPSFPTEFPVKTSIFLSEKGVIISFEKAEKFSTDFLKQRPSKAGSSREFLPYRFFEAWKGQAKKKAKSDVDMLLALPAMLEQHEEDMQDYYDAVQMETMEFDIDGYFDFLSKSNGVVAKTKEKAFGEVYHLVTVRQKFLGNFEYLLRAGCEALNDLYFLIDSEMEASFDLALHGRYIQAMAILRKVLEIAMRGLCLDCQKDKKLARQRLSNWVDKGDDKSSFRDVIEAIIPKKVDKELTDIVNKVGVLRGPSYRRELPDFYHNLSKFVHLKPKTYNYDLELIYPEFKAELFTTYHNTLLSIILAFEALLVFNFPQVIEIDGIGSTKEKYSLLALSEEQCQALLRLSKSKGMPTV